MSDEERLHRRRDGGIGIKATATDQIRIRRIVDLPVRQTMRVHLEKVRRTKAPRLTGEA